MNDPTTRKNTKATKTCPENETTTGPTLNLFERAVQRRVQKFRTKLAKLSGACNIICSRHYLFRLMHRNHFWPYLVVGDDLGSTTDIDRLLVSSGLSTPIFTLIGNNDFWSCHTD